MKEVECNGHIHRIKEISNDNDVDMDTVADLHIELLSFGPMAGLGRQFIKDACYANNMSDGLLKVAVYEIDEVAVGFVAYTDRAISFQKTSLSKHWASTTVTLAHSLIEKPKRILALARALGSLQWRRGGASIVGEDPIGEVVCIAVQPAYAKPEYRLDNGARPAESLISFSAETLAGLGVGEMRMLVEAHNKAPLFLYRGLGARFEKLPQTTGEPLVQVWFDVDRLNRDHACAFL